MDVIKHAQDILRTEANAILSVIPRLNSNFTKVFSMLLKCEGRIVLTGMGKAGIIAQKISATLASTGSPSLYLHPAEAYHGDLGRITKDDIIVALSNSGETEELIRLLPHIKKIGAQIIAITSSETSTLAKHSDAFISIGDIEEAGSLEFAPSASTTAMLALGDAIALGLFKSRNFNIEKFAFYHPGGELGRKLLKVKDVMRTGDKNPVVEYRASVRDTLMMITKARAGAVSIVDKKGKLLGIFTDGDLRRGLEKDKDLLEKTLEIVMTKAPKTISPESFATEAIAILREYKIDELPVVNEQGSPVGMLDVQDLLSAGLV
jgi:arabinose-5-phosphate isomerase